MKILRLLVLFLILSAVSVSAQTSGQTGYPVDQSAYDATTWDGDRRAASKNAIRDKFEADVGSSPASSITVGKSEASYTSIQSAIDSITDNSASKPYAILIYPGTYTENVVIEDYVSLIGIGARTDIVIAGTVTFEDTANNDSAIRNLTVELTTTTDAVDLVTVTDGVIRINNCWLTLISTQNDHVGSLLYSTGGTSLRVQNSVLTLTYSGTAAGANNFFILDVNGSTNLEMTGNKIRATVADEDDTVVLFDQTNASTGESEIIDNSIHLTLSSASFAGIAGAFYIHGSSIEQILADNRVHMTTSGAGTAYALYMDTTAGSGEVHSNGNQYWVENFGTNYSFNVAAGDTIFSHFDDIRAVDGKTGAGTLTEVSSNSDGDLTASGSITGNVDIITVSGNDVLTAAQCQGSVILVTGAYTPVLPDVSGFTGSVGGSCLFTATTAAAFSVDPNANDLISLYGTDQADGEKVTSPGTKGASILMINTSSAGWEAYQVTGLFTNGG